jgi:predicted restriction endonuclease
MVEQACRITGVYNLAYLIASHIKPWRHAENDERLHRNDGLILAPQADFLFDRGFISFGEFGIRCGRSEEFAAPRDRFRASTGSW